MIRKWWFTGVVVLLLGLASSQEWASAQETSLLKPYTSCHFSDGLQIVKIDPLAPGITERAVDTADGVRHISMNAGLRVMFAYPTSDFYANVKVEALPEDRYPELKKWLIENYNYILSTSKDSRPNSGLNSLTEGFDIRGNDRTKLEGGVL